MMMARAIALRTLAAALALSAACTTAAFAQDATQGVPFGQLQLGDPGVAQGATTIWRTKKHREGEVAQDDLAQLLAGYGYAEIRQVKRFGETWRVVAVRNNGALHELTLSASDGAVMERRRVGWTRVPRPGLQMPSD